jgi:hypothetical protein
MNQETNCIRGKRVTPVKKKRLHHGGWKEPKKDMKKIN